jgi:2-oxoglutarate ferredoxin oxidoreductase subunit alpha
LVINSDKVKIDSFKEEIIRRKINVITIPLSSMARDIEIKTSVLANTIAIGAIIALLKFPKYPYYQTLQKRFKTSQTILKYNEQALIVGFDYYCDNYNQYIDLEDPTLDPMKRFVVSGNEMIALGAVSSGLKFLAQYPITPASSILTYLSKRAEKYGIVVKQSEDELAAICMVIGASYAGVRAMTASSGPGISLMSEAFGYAAMVEQPIVIVNSMRAGPSTGIPTKMEQADLYSSIHMSHGESPRAILAPRNIREGFDVTVKAFNIADNYQIPVIILSDFALSESTTNLEPFEMDSNIDRGLIWSGPTEEFPIFKRYQLTSSGISPRAFPGTKNAEYILVGAEHDESSHSLSGNRCGLPISGELRKQMFKKRFTKLENLRNEMTVPDFYGEPNAEYTIISWGSTQGAVKEAVDQLNNTTGNTWNMLSFVDMFPFPHNKARQLFEKINYGIMYEVNYTGQFENLIHHHLDWKPDTRIHPLDGETPTPDMIITKLYNIIKIKEPAIESEKIEPTSSAHVYDRNPSIGK